MTGLAKVEARARAIAVVAGALPRGRRLPLAARLPAPPRPPTLIGELLEAALRENA